MTEPYKTRLDTDPEVYDRPVDPINERDYSDKTRTYEFGFTNIYTDFDDDISFPEGAEWEVVGDRLFYRFKSNAPVMVTGDGVMVHEDFRVRQGEEQAYFVLSMLESKGYVAGWERQ